MTHDEMNANVIQVAGGGFVRLVDHLGGDARIAEAARVSYSGSPRVRSDADLIDYLMRHRHTSPFEQVVLTFHVRMPMFVARQWLRHRTARVNEISGRYVELDTDFFTPASDDLRAQASKQGRGELLPDETRARALAAMNEAFTAARRAYDELLELGVARELARIVLPTSTFTEFYWQIDLHNLFHFLKLRLGTHAQTETRAFAAAIATLAEPIAPLAFTAWRNHVLHSVSFSEDEFMLLADGMDADAVQEAVAESSLRVTRRNELLDKLTVLQEKQVAEQEINKESKIVSEVRDA